MTSTENCSTRLHVMIRPSTKELLTLAAVEEGMSEAELVRGILEQRLPQMLREIGALPISYTKRTRALADTAIGRRRDEMQPRSIEGKRADLVIHDETQEWGTPAPRSEAGQRASLEGMVDAGLLSPEIASQLESARHAVEAWRRYPSDGFQQHMPTGPVE